MVRMISSGALAVLLAVAPLGHAQDAEQGPIYAYATYFICQPDRESRADEIIATSFKPHYDQAVEQGQIVSWSWLQHYIGGIWRRVLVVVTDDMEAALETSGALGEIISDKTPEAGRAFSEICNSHEDYMWESIPGIGGGPVEANRGNVTFSTYLQCDLATEDRADELMQEVLSAVYDAHVRDGELTSWNWLKQNVGGNWRRLLLMGAEDHATLLKARAAIENDLKGRKLERALREFRKICHTRRDYMWDEYLESS